MKKTSEFKITFQVIHKEETSPTTSSIQKKQLNKQREQILCFLLNVAYREAHPYFDIGYEALQQIVNLF